MHRFSTYNISSLLTGSEINLNDRYDPGASLRELKDLAERLRDHHDSAVAILADFVWRIICGETVRVTCNLARSITTLSVRDAQSFAVLKTYSRGFIDWGRRDDPSSPAEQQIQALYRAFCGRRNGYSKPNGATIAAIALWERAARLRDVRSDEAVQALIEVVKDDGTDLCRGWLSRGILKQLRVQQAADWLYERTQRDLQRLDQDKRAREQFWGEGKILHGGRLIDRSRSQCTSFSEYWAQHSDRSRRHIATQFVLLRAYAGESLYEEESVDWLHQEVCRLLGDRFDVDEDE